MFLIPRGGGEGTPLDGLNGDVRPNRVWFSEGFVLNGVSISSIFVLYRVSEPSQKAEYLPVTFLPVVQCMYSPV